MGFFTIDLNNVNLDNNFDESDFDEYDTCWIDGLV